MSAGRQFNEYVGGVDLGPMEGHNFPRLDLFTRVYTSETVRTTGLLKDVFPSEAENESVPTKILSGLILDEDDGEGGGSA